MSGDIYCIVGYLHHIYLHYICILLLFLLGQRDDIEFQGVLDSLHYERAVTDASMRVHFRRWFAE